MKTINTILEKFENLHKYGFDVEIENREAIPEYEIEVSLTCPNNDRDAENACRELMIELIAVAAEFRTDHCKHSEYTFEFEGEEYSVQVWYKEEAESWY